MRARREAQAAEVMVVNHHLLLADLTLREEGFAELLPGADAVIVDEAHQLPEVAQTLFQQMTLAPHRPGYTDVGNDFGYFQGTTRPCWQEPTYLGLSECYTESGSSAIGGFCLAH